MIGLWIFKAYKHGRSGRCPRNKHSFITRIFFTFDSMDNFKDKLHDKYIKIYPDYCIDYDKIFGTSVHYINGKKQWFWK
jgi:hypothetical protein